MKIWTRNTLAAGLIVAFGVWFSYSVFDRSSPVADVRVSQSDIVVHQGQTLQLTWATSFERSCDGILSQKLISDSNIYSFSSRDYSLSLEDEEFPRRVLLTQGLPIPSEAPLGKNIIVTKGVFFCNFWQKYILGISVEFPDVILEVTPAQISYGSSDVDH